MTWPTVLGLQFTGAVSIGTLITLSAVVAGTVALFFKWRQGDPSEWRDNYLGEVTRREDVEKALHETQIALAAERAQKDMQPLIDAISGLTSAQQRSEERMTKRFDAFEAHSRQTAEILTSLVDAVLGVNKAPSRRRGGRIESEAA